MDFIQTAILGAVAGLTIYLGLPVGRIKNLPEKIRSFLAMSSAGILIFLFFDIFRQLSDPIEAAIRGTDHSQFLVLLSVFVLGFGTGLGVLIGFERGVIRRRVDPGQVLSPSRLALLIATGIGLHNFSEGLAIGRSTGGGELAFATILIVGFGLHNATEGFGIVGPLMGKERPSWGFPGTCRPHRRRTHLPGHDRGLLLRLHGNVGPVPRSRPARWCTSSVSSSKPIGGPLSNYTQLGASSWDSFLPSSRT